jgi:hypothetical protein
MINLGGKYLTTHKQEDEKSSLAIVEKVEKINLFQKVKLWLRTLFNYL